MLSREAYVQSKVELSDTILEVGCSDNPLWRGTSFKVITLDLRKNPNQDGYCLPDVLGRAEALPFQDKSFDIVSVCELLEHVPNPQEVLKEALRVARQKVIITVPSEYDWAPELKPFWNPSHVRFYTLATLKVEIEATGLGFYLGFIKNGPWGWLVGEIFK